MSFKFFDLTQAEKKRDTFIRGLPPVPETGWQCPQYFPELRNAAVIGLDTETKETDFDHGPGWGRNEGHIIGVSVAAIWLDGSRGRWYFPVRHEVERETNLDPAMVFGWLREQLHTPHIPKVCANGIYDYGWLSTENIFPQGAIYDVQFAEALIDEDALVNLDALGHKYLGQGKLVDECKEWVLRAYPTANKNNWRGFLWRTPPRLVAPYAEYDADLPLDIVLRQIEILYTEGTYDLWRMECDNIPLLVRMRMQGVPVDLPYFDQLRSEMVTEIADLYSGLSHKVGRTITSVEEKPQLQYVFDSVGIPYPRTKPTKNFPNGNASFRKEWLNALGEINDPTGVAKFIVNIREREKLIGTFIDGYILGRATVDRGSNGAGRIYCSFHPLRSDDGGAKTGRFSSSDPNLQNIPARTKLGSRIRKGFVAEYGHVGYHKKDYSQIEYRLFAHYAVGAGSEEMRQRYINNPDTDYHKDTQNDVAMMRGIDLSAMTKEEVDLDRKPIKNVNFGLLYGQTEKSLAFKAGWTDAQATEFFGGYHGARPFVRTTMQSIQGEVQWQGYVTTLLGRRTRFRQWEPKYKRDRVYRPDGSRQTFSHEEATRRFGANIERAFAYRGVNYKFQGSAADVFKAAMARCYREGVYDYVGYPKLLVHDEKDWSKIDNSPAMNEAFRYVEHVMETTVTCRVPLKVDSTEGATWGDCK